VQRVLLGETAFEISTRYQLRKPIGHGAYGMSKHRSVHSNCWIRYPIFLQG
jgi:hypothetical protein